MVLKKRRIVWLAVLLCLVLVEAAVWYASLDVIGYELSESAAVESVYPGGLKNVEGYSVDGDSYTPENADPQLLFSTLGKETSALAVDFAEPLEAGTFIEFYYAPAGGQFSEAMKETHVAKAGESRVVFPVGAEGCEGLRLDVNGAFRLKSVGVTASSASSVRDLSGRNFGRLAVTILLTAAVVFCAYAADEKRRADADPVPGKIRNGLSTWLPHEKLSVNEKVFLLVCFASYFVWSLVFLHAQYAPDEIMRYDVPKYIYVNGSLPYGYEESIRNPIWGISYGFSMSLPYLLQALFMKVTSFFTISSSALWIAARLVSVLSMTGVAYFAICVSKRLTKQPTRWIFISLTALTPQIVFLGSYVNLDAFSLFTVMFMIYVWVYGMQNEWSIRSCVWLGVGTGLCLLSYEFAYPFALGSVILYFAWHIVNRKRVTFKRFLLRGLLIAGIVLLVSGWYFIRNAVLYNGDIFALNASRPYAEMYARADLKPSMRMTMQKQGYSILGMLHGTDWIERTFKSTFYTFGYMSVFADEYVYTYIWILLCVAAAASLFALFRDRKKRDSARVTGAVVALFCAALTVAISVYFSWASDYQPQGRYVITAAPLLFAIIAYGINGLLGAIPHVGDKLKRYAAYLAVAGVLVFDIYAFVNCLRAFVYV